MTSQIPFCRLLSFLLAVTLLAACNDDASLDEGPSPEEQALLEQELDLGEVNEPGVYDDKSDNFYHNGEPDFSEDCKPIPDREPLNDPEIIVSLDGLTLRLRDRAGDYEKVFPIGPGKLDASGKSLTPLSTQRPGGVFYLRADKPAITDGATASRRRWAYNYKCRIWSGSTYFNPRTGQKEYRSYFAGLPFIRLDGPPTAAYGIHGPITDYWREGGGELKRGYVSGGCLRMEADDLVELFARVQGHKVPTRIQTELDRDADDLAVDSHRFVNSECLSDDDCAVDGARCVENPLSGRSFCTVPCESSAQCPEHDFGLSSGDAIKTHCVANPLSDNPGEGACFVAASGEYNRSCLRYGQFETIQAQAMGSSSSVTVCAPGGDRWVGESCMVNAECATGHCVQAGDEPGICSQPCDRYCPDRTGHPVTRCIDALDGRETGGSCVATCTTSSDCPVGTVCATRDFYGRAGSDAVCVPK